MPATRDRRIIRRAVLALAVVVLLLAAYIGSWFSVSVAWNTGYFPRFAKAPLAFLYGPIAWYAHDSDLPGHAALQRLDGKAYSIGVSRFHTRKGVRFTD